MMNQTSRLAVAILVLAAFIAGGCQNDASAGAGKGGAKKGGPGGPPGAMRFTQSAVVELAKATQGMQSAVGEYQGEFIAEQIAELSADVAGPVTKISVQVGDSVKQGDLLAKIDPVPYRQAVREAQAASAQAKAQRAEARVQIDDIDRQLNQQRPLLQKQLVAQSVIDGLEAQKAAAQQRVALADAAQASASARLANAQENLKRTDLKAPISGLVESRQVEPGRYLSPGTMLFRIVDPDSVVLRVMVPEQDSGLIYLEQKAKLSHQSIPGGSCDAQIVRIAPALSSGSRSLPVDIRAQENCFKAPPRPGMFARATVTLGEIKDAIMVPNQALVRDLDQNQYVWVVKDGKAAKRIVQIGLNNRETTQIVDGLQLGESIVLRGQDRVKEGSDVTEVSIDRDELQRK